MVRSTSVYICQQCGYKSSQYLGRCPQCDSWNSFVETIEQGMGSRVQGTVKKTEIINLSDIQKTDYKRISTGLEEFDRCLGGGIVAGSIVLVSGDPGIGKSTLLTQLAININSDDRRLKIESSNLKVENGAVEKKINPQSSTFKTQPSILYNLSSSTLYVAGEESAQQIKIRVDRIDPKADLVVLNETDVDVICEVIQNYSERLRQPENQKIRNSDTPGHSGSFRPGLVIIDSIQTLETTDLTGVAGSVGQVRESAHRLQRLAKQLHIPIFIVGHVTKEGTVAGPKTLEHLVDVVLSLEGESNSNFRVLRVSKNRFGPTDEVGIFEMEEAGMIEVKNPSELFLQQKVKAPGSAVAITLAGYRPLLIEIQALVTKTPLPIPRRVGLGIDSNRLQILVAVLAKRLSLPLFDKDVFVNVTGGLKVNEPAVDLAVAMAIVSSLLDKEITQKVAFVAEVGLLGELRSVPQMKKRITESRKLGFIQTISADNASSLSQAIKLVFKG